MKRKRVKINKQTTVLGAYLEFGRWLIETFKLDFVLEACNEALMWGSYPPSEEYW